MKLHLYEKRPRWPWTRCNLNSDETTDDITKVTCGMCRNLALGGRNNCARGGDWIRG